MTFLVALTAAMVVVVGTYAAPVRAITYLRVMPLGDSITDGCAICGSAVPGSYRIKFWQRALADGRGLDFVGSQSNGPDELGDKNHEGHVGWRIDEIWSNIDAYLAAADPQVVLVHLGTNDAIQNHDVVNAPGRLRFLIEHITDAKPGVRVLVATLVPSTNEGVQERINYINAAVPAVVNYLTSIGRNVTLVDQASTVTPADIGDGVHPTRTGYDKMGDAFYDALVRTGW